MKEIASAFVKAQKAFGPALKTSINPHFKSKYADLAACVEAVVDALNANGIALMQHSSECSDGVIVETVFLHESGEILSTGKLHVPAQKHDPQGYGSALTYCRRYSLMAACGIAPEDDDGHAASHTKLPIGQKPAGVSNGPRDGIGDDMSVDQKIWLTDLAEEIKVLVKDKNPGEAIHRVKAANLEADQNTWLWNKLPADVRSTLKTAATVAR